MNRNAHGLSTTSRVNNYYDHTISKRISRSCFHYFITLVGPTVHYTEEITSSLFGHTHYNTEKISSFYIGPTKIMLPQK